MDKQINKLLILTTLLSPILTANEDPLLVVSPAGSFKGHILKTRNGRDVVSFEGIPYAKPPVGKLRFKDPAKLPKLDGIYEATDNSKICYQPPFNFSQLNNISAYEGSEDCLYLNVHVPKEKGKELLPVMVWIHGGGFFMGSGSSKLNGPHFFLDKDMILVTINYRLSIFGFLSTGDKAIPGNYGMKDQIMALKWVQENIVSFGGNSNNVAIAGQSAGGAAVAHLMHSPLSKGLFNKAIAQSSTLYSAYAIKPKSVARNISQQVASILGCSFEPELFIRCLQKMPKEEIYAASNEINPLDILGTMEFTPVLEDPSENAFMTVESYNKPSVIPFMTGVTNRESIYLLFFANLTGNGLPIMRKELPNLIPKWGYYDWKPNKDNITSELVKFYFGKEGTENATIAQIVDFASDFLANHGTHLSGKKEHGPTFSYVFSYIGHRSIHAKLPEGLEDAVSHGEDVKYLFQSAWIDPNKEWEKEDLEMSNKMIDMWYNFTKYGKPTPESGIWLESDGGTKYLDISNKGLNMKSNMFEHRMSFLDKLNIDRTM